MRTLQGHWLRSLASRGTNNAITAAGLEAVIERMAREKPLSARSLFVDFGSGAGIPCIYVAKRFGCRTVGVEQDAQLVALATQYAKAAGVGDLCKFENAAFQELESAWLTQQRATHVFVYDAVYEAHPWNALFHSAGKLRC